MICVFIDSIRTNLEDVEAYRAHTDWFVQPEFKNRDVLAGALAAEYPSAVTTVNGKIKLTELKKIKLFIITFNSSALSPMVFAHGQREFGTALEAEILVSPRRFLRERF